MTQTISAPIDLPTETVDTTVMPPCPDFCDGQCGEWSSPDLGDGHHIGDYATMTTPADQRGKRAMWMVYPSRTDADFQAGACDVNLCPDERSSGTTMTPAEARQMAALLMNAADIADPLPVGVLAVQAQHVRIGDQIRTEEGWQTVVGQMVFDDLASVWTDALDRDPDTGGWSFQPADVVIIRRRVHGSAAIAFVEPIR